MSIRYLSDFIISCYIYPRSCNNESIVFRKLKAPHPAYPPGQQPELTNLKKQRAASQQSVNQNALDNSCQTTQNQYRINWQATFDGPVV